MIPAFSSYKVKVRDHEITLPGGHKYSHTAAISFFDSNRKEIYYAELGYVDTQEVFEKIEKGEEVDLDYCYVENFSLAEYRKQKELAEETVVVIQSFSAENCVFEAVHRTDLSFASFQGNGVSFQNAAFIHGGCSFNGSDFGDGKTNFSQVQCIEGDLDFSNVKFGRKGLNFKNSVIGPGLKNFQYADFGDGDVAFANTTFGSGDVLFINCNFGNGELSFKVAIFGEGKKDFHFAKFGEGDISFERAEFGSGKVDFRTVEFGKGKVSFNRAIFLAGDINFDESEMDEGKLTFKNAEFGDGDFSIQQAQMKHTDLSFEKALFGKGVVSFYQSAFHTLSLKSCQLNNYFDLRVEHASMLDMSDTVIRDIVDITPHDFDVDIKVLDLTSVRLLGKIYVEWKDNHLKEIIYGQTKTTYWMKAEQFRILKQNFNTTGRYDDEDLAYIEFKRNEAKAILHEGVKKNKWSALSLWPSYQFKLWVFDKMGLYATSPMRVLVSTLVVFWVFVIVQFILPFFFETSINCIAADATFWTKFWDTAYYSAISYFTIGYGDCSPLGVLRLVAGVEGFVGVFMMSYFVVAFARKVLR